MTGPEHRGAALDGIGRLVASRIREVPDFPSPGIRFKDITPLLADGAAFRAVVRDIAGRHGRGGSGADLVAGIEARGFIIGAAVALELGAGFVPVRKAGKLPGATLHEEYALEYGTARIEIQADAVQHGSRVLLVDDVLATGGTAAAACVLLEAAGARVLGIEVLVELGFLPGRARLDGRPVHSLLTV